MNIKEHIDAGHFPADKNGRALVPLLNGATAIIYMTDYDHPDFPEWCIVGRVIGHEVMEPKCWRADGGYHTGAAQGSWPLDLMPPPPRRIEVKEWAVVDRRNGQIIRTYRNLAAVELNTEGPLLSRVVELTGSFEEPWDEVAPSRESPLAAIGRAHALPDNWLPEEEDFAWAAEARPDLDRAALDAETERFRLHASAHSRTAHRWNAGWRLWISKAKAPTYGDEQQWRIRLKSYRPGKFWLEGDWGPRPESGQSRVPLLLLAEWQAQLDGSS